MFGKNVSAAYRPGTGKILGRGTRRRTCGRSGRMRTAVSRPTLLCSPLDEITWADLSMDTVFERICGTDSAAGEQVLYAWLRCPAMEAAEYGRRRALIRAVEADPDLRLKLQLILSKIGKAAPPGRPRPSRPGHMENAAWPPHCCCPAGWPRRGSA